MSTLLAIALIPPAQAAPSEDHPEWIVTLASGEVTRGLANALARGAGGELGFVYDKVLGGFSFRGPEAAAIALERNPLVSSVALDDGLFQLDDSAGWGVFRIDAHEAHSLDNGAYRGSGIRIAVIDSGIDLDHPDLTPNLDIANGANCVGGTSADDDHGHGTHVAGIAGAAYGPDGFGVAGVAPEATLVPVKTFTADGSATTAQVICGINHVAALASDGIPTIANMSFGENGSDSQCDDGDESDLLHEAICDLANAGVVPVAAAGNSSTSTSTFIPAAFSEVITVSGLTDFDGAPGGGAGCKSDPEFFFDCDDTFAIYSNYGPEIDVMAPGTKIYSTLPGGTHGSKSGTSMAAPHVSGVVAAMLSANGGLGTEQIRLILQASGECPEPAGATNQGGQSVCVDQGLWPDDPDGIAEPLVNALDAVQRAKGIIAPDTSAPVISLLGADPLYLVVGDPYVEPGATAVDDRDGDVSADVVIDASAVDTSVAGSYPVTYNVSDSAGNAADEVVRTVIVDEAPPPEGTLIFTADNGLEVFVNGASVGSSSNWNQSTTVVQGFRAGDVIGVHATDAGGVAGFLAQLDWNGITVVSNSDWKVSATAASGWNQPGFDDSAWAQASEHGQYGIGPWGTRVTGFPSGSSAQWIWTADNNADNTAYFRFVVGP